MPAERGSSGLPGTANTLVLLAGKPRRDQRARTLGRFDHHHAERDSEIKPVARGKSLPRGEKPGGRSLMRRPRSAIASCKSAFSGG